MKKFTLLSSFVLVLSLTAITAWADTIADWTFESTTPTTSGPLSPEIGTGTGTAFHASSGAFFGAVGNGSLNSWAANKWQVGDYWQFSVTTTGYNALLIDFDAISSNTGPGFLSLQYSLDNSSYTAFGADLAVPPPPNWTSGSYNPNDHLSVDVSSVSALDNASVIYFRLVDNSTVSSNGGAVATTGTSRVDNFTVSGNFFANSTYWDTNGSSSGLGGTGTWNTTNTNWNDYTGTGTAVVYDNSKKTIFAGASPGTVTIAAGGITANGGVQFDQNYTVTSDTLTLGTTSTVQVTSAADTATIASKVSGTNGLTKAGSGTLVLTSTSNDFSGNVALNAGTLQVAADSNLGSTSNDIVFGGGKLKVTDNLSLSSGRDVSGGAGSIDVPSTKTLTINGTTSMGTMTLTNSGNVHVNDGSQTSGLTFSANSGSVTVGDGTGTIIESGNIVTQGTSGTSTINGSIDFASSLNRSFTAVAGTTLVVTGNVSHDDLPSGDRVFLNNNGATTGTIDLQGDNTNLPSSVGMSFALSLGPTVIVHNANSLGSGTFTFQSGQLHAASAITFGSGLITQIGAAGSDTQPQFAATFEGSDMEFQGLVQVNKGGPTQGLVTVNNNTTWSGGWAPPPAPAPNLASLWPVAAV